MATGMLNREELIRVTAMAKPTAKLGEKFQYQNIMFAAAGEVVAKGTELNLGCDNRGPNLQATGNEGKRHECDSDAAGARFFIWLRIQHHHKGNAPAADARSRECCSRRRHQFQRQRHGPMAEGSCSPAGRSTANGWYRKRASMNWSRPQINAGPNVDYGLGWVLARWDGHKVVAHDGSIDGFNSLVAMMPDQKLGFVLLTNVSTSPLGAVATDAIWTNLVGRKALGEAEKAAAGSPVDPKTEVGAYKLGGAVVDVAMKEGKLVMTVPGQPPYPLENITGRRYRLGAPAPDGFFATFRPAKNKETETEIYLEQPQGNIVLPKIAATELSPADAAKEKCRLLRPTKGPAGFVRAGTE